MKIVFPSATEDSDVAVESGEAIERMPPNDGAPMVEGRPCPLCDALNPAEAAYCETCGAALTNDSGTPSALSPLPVDSVVGDKYCIERLLAPGDYNVYLAKNGDDTFIVKETSEGCHIFDAEIKGLQQFSYPTLARFIETLTHDGRDYLICSSPPSIRPLHTVSFQSWQEAVRALLSLCQTLQKLHEARILLNNFSDVQWNTRDGRVFVYDLTHSVAFPSGAESDDEEAGKMAWADVNFAAPEVQRHQAHASSDLYALGSLCYKLLFGAFYRPSETDIPEEMAYKMLSLPPALPRVLSACLQSNPAYRPNSVDAIKSEFVSLLAIRRHIWEARSDIGQYRSQNQDAYFAQSLATYAQSGLATVGLYLVADGMGGGKAGDVASQLVVETCRKGWGEFLAGGELLQKSDEERLRWIRDLFDKANAAIIETANGEEMGSTATLCLAINQQAFFGHIGDSRAYLIDNTGIKQLTDDHSLVAHLVRTGQFTPEEAEVHPQRHVIYKTLGIERRIEPDCFMRLLKTDQALLICSDGLCGMVSDEEMYHALSDQRLNHAEKVNLLINMANQAGGRDNITVVYVTFH